MSYRVAEKKSGDFCGKSWRVWRFFSGAHTTIQIDIGSINLHNVEKWRETGVCVCKEKKRAKSLEGQLCGVVFAQLVPNRRFCLFVVEFAGRVSVYSWRRNEK